MKRFFAFWPLAAFAVVCASAQTPVFSTGQAARLVIGQKNFTQGEFGASNKLIGAPSGVALANGVLWVVDANRLGSTPNNNRVLRFADVNTYPGPGDSPQIVGSTCGVCRGDASLVLGQPDFITTNANLSATGLRNPYGIASDGTILAIADTDNNRVLIWNSLPRATGQPADVVVGQADFTHNATSIPPTQTSLRGPTGVWISGGKLFIADTQDNRVLIYNRIPTANKAPADVVIGQTSFTAFVQPDLTQSKSTTSAANMQTPVSVTSDGVRMFVADLAQNRILIWNSIPAANGAAADVVIGQPGLTSGISNYSFTGTPSQSSTDTTNKETPVMCTTPTSLNDFNSNPTYPLRCASTLSFPRFALSDGKRLFVADGGNDRILVFNTIPTKNGSKPDAILGQPDENSDNTGDNPDGANALQTPVSLAWDGTNLFVADTYNRRVVVYSPGILNIPLDGVRNAASKQIYALGAVTIGGAIQAKDTVTITINGTAYAYTVDAKDTLLTVLQKLTDQINKAPDKNVTATANISQLQIGLTARTPGATGGTVSVAVATATTATGTGGAAGNPLITAITTGAALNIFLENPSQIAPAALIQVAGTDLCQGTGSADLSQPYAPTVLSGCSLFIDGIPAPLLSVSPVQIIAQMPGEVLDRTSVSLFARSVRAGGAVVATAPVAVTIVPQNPGLFAQDGTDPRPGIVYHASAYAIGMVSVDGSAQEGDTLTVTIGGVDYGYTVKAGDTLAIIRDSLIGIINSTPDPFVTATASNEYTRIVVRATTPGPAGESITLATSAVTISKNTGGPQGLLTAFNGTLCCSNTQGALVTVDNPAVPGESLYTFATGLGVTQPNDVDTGRVFPGGSNNPPATPVDSIITGGLTANTMQVSLVPGTVGVYYVQFLLNTGLPNNNATQMTIAQQAFVSNVVTFPVQAPGSASRFKVTPSTLTAVVDTEVTFTVTAVGANGTTANLYAGTVSFTSNDGGATLPANSALTAGLGTFTVKFSSAGFYNISVADSAAPGVTGTSPSISVTATAAPRTVVPAPAAVRLPWRNRR